MSNDTLTHGKDINWWLREGANKLSHLELPRLESILLLSHALKKSKEEIYASPNQVLDEKTGELFLSLVKRRSEGEPSAYILGKKEFFDLELEVNHSVLIPRPDTEIIVEKAIEIIDAALTNKKKNSPALKIVDCCTGSGAIIIALAKRFKQQINENHLIFYGCDISKEALAVAKKNQANHNLQNKIEFLCGNLLLPLASKAPFFLIVTNPPYLTKAECDEKKEKGWHEPNLALEAGEDGLLYIKKIIKEANSFLEEGGHLLIEASSNQMKQIDTLLGEALFKNINITKDLANRDRVIGGQLWKT